MFVHLRLHTEFSVVDGTNRIDEVVATAAADGQPALAITDFNNLFGAIKFYRRPGAKASNRSWAPRFCSKARGGSPDAPGPAGARPTGLSPSSELLARAWTRNVVKIWRFAPGPGSRNWEKG